jgi:hypothetical protein
MRLCIGHLRHRGEFQWGFIFGNAPDRCHPKEFLIKKNAEPTREGKEDPAHDYITRGSFWKV